MRVIPVSWSVFLLLVSALLFIPSAVAQERGITNDAAVPIEWRLVPDRELSQPSPPVPPLPGVGASVRGPIPAGEMHAVTGLAVPGSPDETTVVLPLSAGLSVVSLPLRVPSERLSDIFPNLPEGSRAWIWDASHQKFVEGLDHQLPLGHACWLYVPVPVLLVVNGRTNLLHDVSFDLEKGWNLIGVPYVTALLRSQQQVYVNWAPKPLNDAVAAGDVRSSMFSFDVNGYETVAEDGSFQPLHGYWVYASGAELLELKRPGLSDIMSMIPWGTVLSTGFGFIMTQMGYSDTAKLNQTLAKLDTITQTQAVLNAKLDTVIKSLNVKQAELLGAINDATYVAPVKTALAEHYDQLNGPPQTSLAWLVAKAKAGIVAEVTISNAGSGYTSVPTVTFAAAPQGGITATGTATVKDGAVTGVTITNGGSGYTSPPAVTFTGGGGTGAAGVVTLGATMATKSDFARKILNDWDFINVFDNITTGIAGTSAFGKGIFDNFADYVFLKSQGNQYDLKNYYVPMETYFSTLLGMQIKCGTLIMNAYDQLANDPATTDPNYTPQRAAEWKRDVFDPTIKAETERFLQAVESIAVRELPVPATWSDPPVKVPDHVQVVMGLADLYVMETLKQIYPDVEGPGVRVRIMVNPGSGTDLPHLKWADRVITLPSFDTWRTYAGSGDYADWILPRDSKTRAFKVTSTWKVVRVILPVTSESPNVGILIYPADSPWWWWVANIELRGAPYVTSAALTQTGTLFGSFTFASRPTTRDVFDPCIGGWPRPTTNWTQNCFIFSGSDCDYGGVTGGCAFYFHGTGTDIWGNVTSWMTMTYGFTYQGDDPIPGTWTVKADGTFTGDDGCTSGLGPPISLVYQFFKGNYPSWTTLDSSETCALPQTWLNKAAQTVQVTWEPGQIYTFQAMIKVAVGFRGAECRYYWNYGGAAITFP